MLESVGDLLLASKGTLQSLYRHYKLLNSLQVKLKLHLGSPLNSHCWVSNFENGRMVLCADSASWANQLRFRTPSLLADWSCKDNATFDPYLVKEIVVKVCPRSPSQCIS